MIPDKLAWDEWVDKVFCDIVMDASVAHGSYRRHQRAYRSGFETLTANVAIDIANGLYEKLKEWDDSFRSIT